MDTIQACSPSYLSSPSFVVLVQIRHLFLFSIIYILTILILIFLFFTLGVGDVCVRDLGMGETGLGMATEAWWWWGGGGSRFYLVSILLVCGESVIFIVFIA